MTGADFSGPKFVFHPTEKRGLQNGEWLDYRYLVFLPTGRKIKIFNATNRLSIRAMDKMIGRAGIFVQCSPRSTEAQWP
ncbi:MAG: hypothetical protein A4E19_05450 [Nitrospira sp. SG-bin1]|nr:MAG: hypothetical protein A4E19_05450 [Nitrospira sp. SG-bin1]